jgi:transcriptional regulator with XRE-family HTH domain
MADIDPRTSVAAWLAHDLARHREANGESQEELSKVLRISRSTLADYETNARRASAQTCEAADGHYGTDRHFQLLNWHARPEHRPEWFQIYLGREPLATHIRIFQPQVIPGLFQTEDYARAIYVCGHEPDVEGAVADRIRRQAILTRTDPAPPHVWAVLDEAVFLRPYGGRAAMAAQLKHLLGLIELPNVNIQVIPLDAGEYTGSALGTFLVLTAPDDDFAYTEAHLGGRLIEEPEEVEKLMLRFGHIQVNALPVHSSAEIIRNHLERFT